MADNVQITEGVGTAVAADELTDGTLGTVKVQYVKIMDGTLAGTSKATVGAGGLVVDLGTNNDVTITSGTVAATQSGTWNITNISGTISLPTGAATETTLASLLTSSGNVDTNTDNILADTTTISTIVGGVAHDSVDSGNPFKIGAKATTALSGLTLVASADRTNLFAGVDGVLIVRNHCNLEDIVTGNASNTDGTSTQCIAAQAAGIKTYLTRVTITNTSSTNIYIEIKDGTTVKHTMPAPALCSGSTVEFDPPIPGTAATAWNFDPSSAVTSIICSMVGFKSKV